jgi:hypothetical protein
MIGSKSKSVVNILLVIAGAALVVEASIALALHEPPLHLWSAAPKGQAWEVMFVGAFCFLLSPA